jgi:hypothetical protein
MILIFFLMVDLLTIPFAFIILGCFNLSLKKFVLLKKKDKRKGESEK